MNKKSLIFVPILLLLIVFALEKNDFLGPKIDKPFFVKSLIYSEDMDIDVNYIAPLRFRKSVEKIQIVNAPKGIDCVVYGEDKELKSKYCVGTINIGVNCEYWNEQTGMGNDLEIKELLITWSDGSQTTENIGKITIMGGNDQCNNYMQNSKQGDTFQATYKLIKDTEITGLDLSYKEELLKTFSDIKINDVPLENISKDKPIKLKKNQICTITYQQNDNEFEYGTIRMEGFLLGKSNANEEKIAICIFHQMFSLDERMSNYLISN